LQYTDWEHLGDGYLNQKKIAEVVGDYFFICPTNLFAEYFAARGTRVYYYYFTQVKLVSRRPVLSTRISKNAATCLCEVKYVMTVFHFLQLLKILKEYSERLIEIIFPEANLM
jgi:acetylcholinesterase